MSDVPPTNPIEQRIQEINERLEWMNENLHGCDWCCGGGDQEWIELQEELKQLQQTPA